MPRATGSAGDSRGAGARCRGEHDASAAAATTTTMTTNACAVATIGRQSTTSVCPEHAQHDRAACAAAALSITAARRDGRAIRAHKPRTAHARCTKPDDSAARAAWG